MAEPSTELVLPFAVIEREGGSAEEFPFEMTLATVLADVEREREKAGMLRKREEGLEFASILYWPIVVAPWRENRHLVFDGMGVWSYVFPQGRIPDARAFAAAVEGAKDYKSALAVLNERASYFDGFQKVDNQPVMGLFIHEELMRDILAHLALAKPRQIRGTPVLAQRLSAEHARTSVERLRGIVEAMAKEIQMLADTGKALERGLDRARSDVAQVRDQTIATYNRRIEELRPDVNAQVARLEREREERWSAMQPKLLDLQTHTRKVEADLAAWDAESRRRDDLAAAAGARQQRDAARYELDRARGEVAHYQEEMAQTRGNFDRQVQAQWDRIREIERERDAQVAKLNQEEQALTALAGKLSLGMTGLTKQLQDGIAFLEAQGVQATVSGLTTIRLPIFVASFASDRGRRIVVYPPMVAKAGKGVLGGIKSTFGGAVLPLEPKTQQFEEIFRAGIEKAFMEDASLAAYVASIGNGNNLLHLGNLREMLARGLGEMKRQGWIKDKHERDLILMLERHITAAQRTAPRPGP